MKVPKAPEDRCNQHEHHIDPTVIIGGVFLAIWTACRLIQVSVNRDPVKPFLQLTVWTAFIVPVFFLTMRKMPQKDAGMIGVAVLALSLLVGIGRTTSMNIPTKSNFDVYRDFIDHYCIPIAVVFLMVTRRIPRPGRGKHEIHASIAKSAAVLFGVLATWFVVNYILMQARGTWVYGKHANPTTPQGRKTLGLLAAGALACLAISSIIEKYRPKSATRVANAWPRDLRDGSLAK